MRETSKGRVSVEMSVHFNIVLPSQSRCHEKPAGSNNILNTSILVWEGRDVLKIFMTDSEMYRPPYLNIYYTQSYEENIENKSTVYE